MIRVYIAAHTENQAQAIALRDLLRSQGIGCCARWLEQLDVPRESVDGAETCLEDIERADVVILLNPKALHGMGTGGRHTECGMALALRKPLLIVGEAENVFHSRAWRAEIVPSGISIFWMADIVRQAAQFGTPLAVAPAALPPARVQEGAQAGEGKVRGAIGPSSLSDRDKVALLLRQMAASAMNGTRSPVAAEDVSEVLADAAFLIDGKTLQEAAREVDATW